MEKIIEQIKEIKGVKTVEVTKKGFKGTFEPQLTSVKVETLEQLDFMWLKYFGNKHGELYDDMCIYATSDMEEKGFDCEEAAKRTSNLISFTQYLKDYALQDEWEKYLIGEAKRLYPVGTKFAQLNYCEKRTIARDSHFGDCKENSYWICAGGTPESEWGKKRPSNPYIYKDGKWAEIIKEDIKLVEGEIYFWEERIIRFKSMHRGGGVNLYSQRVTTGSTDFYLDSDNVGYRTDIKDIKPATDKQKRKLIKAEVKNNYFHELAK